MSAGIASDTATRVMSGTSMSAPMVAGSAAVYRATNPSANPATVAQVLTSTATAGVVTNIDSTSPNRLLYSWLSGAPAPTPTPTPTATPTASPSPTATPAQIGRITIKKRVRNLSGGPSSTTAFPYEATNIPTSNFTLVDNQEFTDPSVPSTAQVVAVTEQAVSGWRLVSIECVELAGQTPNIPNTTVDVQNKRANISVEDGETVTCTFTSEELIPTAAHATVGGRIVDQDGRGVRGVSVTLLDASTGEIRYVLSNNFGYYYFSDVEVANFYVLTAVNSKRYAIENNERSFVLHDDLADVDFIAERNDG
jgi:hypothetical protein